MSPILLAFATFAAGAMSPGPAIFAIMGTALAHGRGAATRFGLGVFVGSCVWGLLATAGVAALIEAHARALSALKIAGGLYLLWLATKAARSALRDAPTPTVQTARRRFVAAGAALQLTNPKSAFTWAAAVSIGLPAGASAGDVALLLAACMAVSLVVNIGSALAFSTGPMVSAYRLARRRIEATFAALFAAFGIGLLAWRP